MTRVVEGLRKRHAHDRGRCDGTIQPRELHHVEDGAHAPALLADTPSKGSCELYLRGGVRAIAELILQAHEPKRIDSTVGPKSRHEKAGQPTRGLRKHQEGIAHGRRHEPLVASNRVSIALALGTGGIRADIRAALFFRHSHSKGDARFLPPRHKAPIVLARKNCRAKTGRWSRLDCERGEGRPRHGDGAQVSGFDLRGHVEASRTEDLRWRCCRVSRIAAPGRSMQPGGNALRHKAGWNSTMSSRNPLGSKRRSLGGFSLASRARSNISAVPQRQPNSASTVLCSPPPFAATASRRGLSLP